MTEGEAHEVNIVLKAEVSGPCGAISDLLPKLKPIDEAKAEDHRFYVAVSPKTDAVQGGVQPPSSSGYFNAYADAPSARN